jgi:hypothetical protein
MTLHARQRLEVGVRGIQSTNQTIDCKSDTGLKQRFRQNVPGTSLSPDEINASHQDIDAFLADVAQGPSSLAGRQDKEVHGPPNRAAPDELQTFLDDVLTDPSATFGRRHKG